MAASKLDNKVLGVLTQKIYRSHPDFANVKPKVRKQKIEGKSSSDSDHFLLIFSNTVDGPGGQRIKKNLRVVVNSKGKIIKKSVSK
jgi:hypothetical protein